MTGYENLLFRGIERPEYFERSLRLGPYSVPSLSADFGQGQYYSTYGVAVKYAGSEGVICVHRWEWTEGCSELQLRGEHWLKTVKWGIAGSNNELPDRGIILQEVNHDEDSLVGHISDNFWEVFDCIKPKPRHVDQRVAKTPAAFNVMARNLVAVIYLDPVPGQAYFSDQSQSEYDKLSPSARPNLCLSPS
jgi:hypothetical protein